MREGAAGARVALFLPASRKAVGADDAVRVADDLADVLVAHTAVNAACRAVVFNTEVEERRPRVLADHFRVLGDISALGKRRLGGGIHIHAAPAACVEIVVVVGGGGVFHLGSQLFTERRVPELVGHGGKAVFKVPWRHTGVQRRHVSGVRILVADNADALVVCLVYQAQRFLLLAPVGLTEHLVVRDINAHARLTADVYRLLDRVHDEVCLIAHMACVYAAERLDDLCKLDDLLFLCVAARRVDKAGGEACGAVLHCLAENALHSVELPFGRRAVVHTHYGNAQGAVADVHFRVGGELLLVRVFEIAGEAAPVFHVLREPCRTH